MSLNFEREANATKIRDMRITCALACTLLLVFGFVDRWALPSVLGIAWLIRACAIAFLIGVFAYTRRPGFLQHYKLCIVTAYAVMAASVNALVLSAGIDDVGRDSYFVALILIIMGLYTWVHLNAYVVNGLAVGIVLSYAVVMIFQPDYYESERATILAINFCFLCGSALIGTMSYATRARYAKNNRQLRTSLHRELEREERARQHSEHAARHDQLTGLPNRAQLGHRTNEMLQEASASGTSIALLFIDIDGFKQINDNHGHAVGDRVLKLIAERLKAAIRRDDLVARLGGDEFVVVVEVERDQESFAQNFAIKLEDIAAQTMDIEGQSLRVGASVGIARYPQDGDSLVALLKISDERMYINKRAKSDRRHIA